MYKRQIEDTVNFSSLGFVVIDEQHRFGVAQRARLWSKNVQPPHVLVMTATPVSYTHLDVYKRQTLYLPAWISSNVSSISSGEISARKPKRPVLIPKIGIPFLQMCIRDSSGSA